MTTIAVSHTPLAQLARSARPRASSWSGSRPAVGSSNSSISGSPIERARDARRACACRPTARTGSSGSTSSPSPTSDRKLRPRARGSPPRRRLGVLAQRIGDVLVHRTASRRARRPGRRSPCGGGSAAAPPRDRRSMLLPKSADARRCPAGSGPPIRRSSHRLAGAAAAHDHQRLALVERRSDTPRSTSWRLEALAQTSDAASTDRASRRGRSHHQKSIRKSLVRKKSEMITPMVTCTTVAVVARPSPSVPPVGAEPVVAADQGHDGAEEERSCRRRSGSRAGPPSTSSCSSTRTCRRRARRT